MSNPFFDHPILNSPYEYPRRHWELDETGQPTQKIVDTRRGARFITPIPKPKKRKAQTQAGFVFDEGKGLSSAVQQYDPTSIINEVRGYVDSWRALPNPSPAAIRGWPWLDHDAELQKAQQKERAALIASKAVLRRRQARRRSARCGAVRHLQTERASPIRLHTAGWFCKSARTRPRRHARGKQLHLRRQLHEPSGEPVGGESAGSSY